MPTEQQPWEDTFARGAEGVDIVVRYLEARGHAVERATREQERMGLDLITVCPDGFRRGVEVKADAKAAVTGNLFVETISVFEAAVPGWAYTSLAGVLAVVIPPAGKLVLAPMGQVKANLASWLTDYQVRQSATSRGGRSWTTMGVPVPLPRFVGDTGAVEVSYEPGA